MQHGVYVLLSVLWHWLGDRKGIRPIKAGCLLVVMIWLKLRRSFSTSCHHHLHHPYSNKIQNGGILLQAYPGLSWKMAVKWVLLLLCTNTLTIFFEHKFSFLVLILVLASSTIFSSFTCLKLQNIPSVHEWLLTQHYDTLNTSDCYGNFLDIWNFWRKKIQVV